MRHALVFGLALPFALSCSKVEAPVARPAWCANAVSEIDRSRVLVPPRDVVPESLDDLAKRMDAEAAALSELVPKDGGEALEAAADADSGVSAAAAAILSRRSKDAPDTGAAERALAVVLRERERSVLVIRGQCGLASAPIEQADDWKKKADAVVASLQPALRACAEDVPQEEQPKGMNVVVQVDPTGKATLATAVDFTFDFGKWSATNVAHCMIKRLEATRFPEPKGNATVLVSFGGGASASESGANTPAGLRQRK